MRVLSRALGLMAVIAILSVTTSPADVHAQAGEDPAALAAALDAAINAGDLDGAVALFHDDAVYETPSCPVGGCVGRTAIREILATFIADELRITSLEAFRVDGTEVRGRSASESLGLREAGVERIIVIVIGTVRDGLFERWRVIPDLNDAATADLFAPALPATGSGGLAMDDGRRPIPVSTLLGGLLVAVLSGAFLAKRRV